MYRIDNQISLAEFISPFGELDQENRWVKIAGMIPWEMYEEKYAEQFCDDNGSPAIKFRMAMGTLIIKQTTSHSDDEVVQDIIENPYMQFLIGLHEFTTTPPFSASSITNFRKYISAEMINEINNLLFRAVYPEPGDVTEKPGNNDEDRDNDESDSQGGGDADSHGNIENPTGSDAPNKGTLILDATCAPADIAYPTDVNLLNEAREKLEAIIDTLQPYNFLAPKPRTYRFEARREYLSFALKRRPGVEKVREAIKKQLAYVARNIRHIDAMLERIPLECLSIVQQAQLTTIRILYTQQLYMYENNTHSVGDRIVSIGQPHVRPIVRGKAKAPVEFGAKISISLTGGYSFLDRLSWDAYNEDSDLISAVETYKRHNGCYPERVLADKIYRTKENREYCKRLGIRLSGPPLGRRPKETEKELRKQEARDSADRNPVEGKFGEGKSKYGLNRIMARIKESSETVISMAFLCMNISKRLRELLRFFQIPALFNKYFVDNFSVKRDFYEFVVFG
jgi:hypothetical protein